MLKGKDFKSEEFPLGQNTGKFPNVFFYGLLSTAPKAFFFLPKNHFFYIFLKHVLHAFDEKQQNIASPKSFQ